MVTSNLTPRLCKTTRIKTTISRISERREEYNFEARGTLFGILLQFNSQI